jgi:glycosyltransferase involved in cell wall biosynthesis
VFPLIVHAVRRKKKPHVLYVVGDIREVVGSGGKYPWLARMLVVAPIAEAMHRVAVRAGRSSMVIAVSSSLAQLYGSSAVQSVTFAPTAVAEGEILDRQDTCQSTPTRLLFVGRLVPVKGLVYLFEAVRLLLHDGVPVRLTLVGSGPRRKALIALAAKYKLASVIDFRGEVSFGPSLLALYREADIFVLPSLSEGTPRVLWEAMAAGLPIVATRVGGVPEIIREGETGLLASPRSAQRLAPSIRRVIEDEELRMRLIRGGYSLIREHTVEKQAAKLWKNITAYLERDL